MPVWIGFHGHSYSLQYRPTVIPVAILEALFWPLAFLLHSLLCVWVRLSQLQRFIGGILASNTLKKYGRSILAGLQRADWGLPTVMISDRDPRFVQGTWKALFTALGTHLAFTTAYHPQADGQSERTNQTAEIMIRHWAAVHPGGDLEAALPGFQATLNSSVSIATCYSPHKLLYGIDLR